MPTISVTSLVSATSATTTSVAVQQSSTGIASLPTGLHPMQLETSMGFSLVFAALVVGLVMVRHFVARSRSGPIDMLS